MVCFCAPLIDEATQSVDGRTLISVYQMMIVFHIIVIVTLFVAKRRRDKDKVLGATMVGWFIALNIYLTIFPSLFYVY